MKRIADCIVPSSATFAAGARTEDSGGALAAGFVVLLVDDGVLELRISEWSLSIVVETRNVSLWLTVESFEAALKITCATARTAIREQPWEAAPIRPTRRCPRCRGATVTRTRAHESTRRNSTTSGIQVFMLQKGQLFHNGRNGRETNTTAPRTFMLFVGFSSCWIDKNTKL